MPSRVFGRQRGDWRGDAGTSSSPAALSIPPHGSHTRVRIKGGSLKFEPSTRKFAISSHAVTVKKQTPRSALNKIAPDERATSEQCDICAPFWVAYRLISNGIEGGSPSGVRKG